MDMHGVAETAALGLAAAIRSTVPLTALSLTLPRRRLYGAPLALASPVISGDRLAIATSTVATRRLRRPR